MTYAELTMKSGAVVRIDCDKVTGRGATNGRDLIELDFVGSSKKKRRHVHVNLSEVVAVVEVDD